MYAHRPLPVRLLDVVVGMALGIIAGVAAGHALDQHTGPRPRICDERLVPPVEYRQAIARTLGAELVLLDLGPTDELAP